MDQQRERTRLDGEPGLLSGQLLRECPFRFCGCLLSGCLGSRLRRRLPLRYLPPR